MWMGPHGHVVHYPVRRGELLNIVAHLDSDGWTEESWTHECDVSEVTAAYAKWHRDLTRIFPSSTRWYKWALYDRDPLPALEQRPRHAPWRLRACHAALSRPGRRHGGRGRLVLAAMVARHADDLGTALLAYEQTRAPRAKAAVLGSRARQGEPPRLALGAAQRDVKFKLRERLGAGRSDNTAFKVGWLYGYDVGKEME